MVPRRRLIRLSVIRLASSAPAIATAAWAQTSDEGEPATWFGVASYRSREGTTLSSAFSFYV